MSYGCDVARFLHTLTDNEEYKDESEELNVVPVDCTAKAELYNKQLEAINGVLKRDHMKVSLLNKF